MMEEPVGHPGLQRHGPIYIYIYHRTNLRVDLRGVLIRRASSRREGAPHFCRQAAAIVHGTFTTLPAAVCATLKFTSVISSEKSSHLHSVREWHHFFTPKCIPFESGTTFTSHPANQPIQPSQPAASQPASPASPASQLRQPS